MKQSLFGAEWIGNLCMALEQLIHAGIGTADALTLLTEDETEPACREILRAMAEKTDAGSSLSEAAREAGRFPGYVTTLLAVGEATGKLEDTLRSLGEYYRRRGRLQRQLRMSLTYPAVLLAVLLAVAVVLLVWVLPVFDRVYAGLGSGLTGVAGVLLRFGMGLKQALPVIGIVLLVLLAVGAIPGVRKGLTAWIRKHRPHRGVGGNLDGARFLQALSLCVSSGMSAQEAVEMATALSGASGFQKRCRRCAELVEQGQSLSAALRQTQLLDGANCRLLEAGERSGRSAVLLERIAEDLLEAGEEALQRKVSRIEPVMVAVVCGIIGLVLLSVMLPLMDIMSAIG